ncbi:MAG TPA: hypothetical protein VNQ97_04660 [Burkholderiaceae bacterium]|nr:hypothetical protein [Burkholderiaceae bacterium]
MTTANTTAWGFLHPECHGDNALVFFSSDLARTIDEQFSLHVSLSLEGRLAEAQKAVDRLLKQYVQIQANPYAFEGQHITLRLQADSGRPDEAPVLALETSEHLEALLIQAQAAQQASRSLN